MVPLVTLSDVTDIMARVNENTMVNKEASNDTVWNNNIVILL